MWKTERESFPSEAEPQHPKFDSRGQNKLEDGIVFIKIANAFAGSASNIAITDVGFLGKIFTRRGKGRARPGFLSGNSCRKEKQRPGAKNPTERSTCGIFHSFNDHSCRDETV